MKKIIYLTGLVAVLATAGCVVDEEHHRHHDDVVVRPVEVRPPEVIVK